MDLDLHNVHVLITGAAGGIGLATAKQFLTHGALVSAHYRSTKATLESDDQCSRAIQEGRLVCVQGDVRSEEDVERMFAEAEKAMGRPVAVLVGEYGVGKKADDGMRFSVLRKAVPWAQKSDEVAPW